MKLTPLGNRVLIAPIAAKTESSAWLELVQDWQPEIMGTVKAIGSAAKLCKVGDQVIFSWTAGQDIRDFDADTRYLLLKEDDLIAVIEKDDA